MRKYKGKEIDLMAPSGNLESFKKIVESKCDSIFIGGKTLNMRLIRKGYNFSNDDLIEAINLAHSRNKKVYITLNILINEMELKEAEEYLIFLESINVDAIIVQDLGILEIIKNLGLNLKVHSSVQMNSHDVETIKFLKNAGIKKIVLSRESTIEEIEYFYKETKMSFEYFCYGDMCVAKDAQCSVSSFILGNNSGRGRCFKMCRWNFNISYNGKEYNNNRPLSVKDLSLYEYIDELHNAGIETFKIEGRMRDADFIVPIINSFGNAIDELIETGKYNKDDEHIYNTRIRDLATGFIKGNPKLEYINKKNEDEIKVFSKSTDVVEINNDIINEINKKINKGIKSNKKKISVYVKDVESAIYCIDKGVDRVYLSVEFEDIENTNFMYIDKKSCDLYIATPRTMNDERYKYIARLLETGKFDGVLYSTFGCIEYFKGYNLITDTNLLMYNSKAIKYCNDLGVQESAVSFELQQNEFIELLKNCKNDMEIVVHGIMPLLYTYQDLYENVEDKNMENKILQLKSDNINFDVIKDRFNMNHILSPKELYLAPLVKNITKYDNVKTLRIDGRFYKKEELGEIIELYKNINENKKDGSTYKSKRSGLTIGALNFGDDDEK